MRLRFWQERTCSVETLTQPIRLPTGPSGWRPSTRFRFGWPVAGCSEVGRVVIAGMWKTFAKAGQPGWGVLIPIYNAYLLTQIAGKPGWWVLLMFIPLVNLVISVIISVAVGENFGKGSGFGIGLFILPIIFYPILGFGDATYRSR